MGDEAVPTRWPFVGPRMGADGSKQLSNAHGTYTAQDAELFDAACDNDEGRIMELLASGANPDSYRHQVVSLCEDFRPVL